MRPGSEEAHYSLSSQLSWGWIEQRYLPEGNLNVVRFSRHLQEVGKREAERDRHEEV